MDSVDLSIIIPTFHREEQLVGAIQSVLVRAGDEFEVLVADDSPEGSAEPFVKKIEDKRLHYMKRDTPTGGNPAIVRNERARTARGRYFYFLDDDDTASPATLVALVKRLDETGHGVGIGIVRPFGKEGSQVVAEEQEHYRQAEKTLAKMRTRYELASCLLFRSAVICCSACVIRRESFVSLGGFDSSYPLYEDVAMYLRGIRRFGFDFVGQVLLNRRTGEPSLIQNERNAERTHTSYRMMHDNYRKEFGLPEYAALKAISFTLPRSKITDRAGPVSS